MGQRRARALVDSSEAADIADPIDPAEANEPTLANDANEAALPIESTESWEQIERTEFSDQSDHTPSSVTLAHRVFPTPRLAVPLDDGSVHSAMSSFTDRGLGTRRPGEGDITLSHVKRSTDSLDILSARIVPQSGALV